MVETTADVRRDIELTRERMSSTLAELEHKLNIVEVVKEHPWPSLALAVGAGVLLSGSSADVTAAADGNANIARLQAFLAAQAKVKAGLQSKGYDAGDVIAADHSGAVLIVYVI